MTKQERDKKQNDRFFTRSLIDIPRTLEYQYQIYLNHASLMGEYKKNYWNFSDPGHRKLYEKFHNEEVKFSQKAARLFDLISNKNKLTRLNYDVNV